MKKILIGAGAVALLAIVVVASLRQTASGRGVRVYMEDAAKLPRLLATVSASGEVKPRVEVNISSQVPGQIVALPVAEGDHAKAGQVLVQLDPERYRSEVRRLEASLRMATVNEEKERVALKTAEMNLNRLETLHAQKIVSDDALDQARLSSDSSRITLQSLGEQIQQAEADLSRARDDLSKTTLKAPISGLVSRLNAKVGEQVIIGTMNNPGTVILTLSDMTEVLSEVRVDETDVTQVKAGQVAQVRVDAVEGHPYAGAVESIGNAAEREGTVSKFPVKIHLTAPDDRLRPGMSAHADIEVNEKHDVLTIPLQAIVRRSLKDFQTQGKKPAAPESGVEAAGRSETSPAPGAYSASADGKDPEREQVQVVLVDRGGKVQMVEVKTGISDAFRAEVLEGLNVGEKVILGPYRKLRSLKNGDAVRRVEKSEAGEDEENAKE
jgi:HlyD family secretion protein